MIIVVDNFFPDDVFQRVHDEIKSCDFIPISSKMKSEGVDYPGARTKELKDISTQFDRFIVHHIRNLGLPITNQVFKYWQYAHLRLKKDNKKDYIHTDIGMNFAWLIYMSETNLESGTKFYTEDDNEHTFARFVQNRIVLFAGGKIKHMAFNNHGKDLTDGRLTINGFASYNMEK